MPWYNRFNPDLVVNSYKELSLEDLKTFKCKNLLIDIDNTLVSHQQSVIDKPAREFIEMLLKEGYNIVLFSNNNKERVSIFADSINLPYVNSAIKPLPMNYKKVFKAHNFDPKDTVAIGDQLMTDVWGAHNAGIKVIWSKPLVKKDIFYTSINRMFEKIVHRVLIKKGLLDE